MKQVIFPILFLYNTLLFSQQLSLDTNVIKIGEQITLNIIAEFEAEESVAWPVFHDTIITEIEIIQRGEIDSIKSENKLKLSQ